jgi:hypothetical protein
VREGTAVLPLSVTMLMGPRHRQAPQAVVQRAQVAGHGQLAQRAALTELVASQSAAAEGQVLAVGGSWHASLGQLQMLTVHDLSGTWLMVAVDLGAQAHRQPGYQLDLQWVRVEGGLAPWEGPALAPCPLLL